MGRISKYSEDSLLMAVIRYADVCPGIIKATELAQWANGNILELKGVQPYHFLRPLKVPNSKTGKTELRDRECKIRIDEINQSRETCSYVEGNLIFSSVNMEQFFDLGRNNQLDLLQNSRTQYLQMKKDAIRQRKEIEELKEKLKQMYKLTDDLAALRKEIEQKTTENEKQVRYILKMIDEETRKSILNKTGISEMDLRKYNSYMQEKDGQLLSIQNLVNRYMEMNILDSRAYDSDDEIKDDTNSQSENNIQNSLDNILNLFLAKQDSKLGVTI